MVMSEADISTLKNTLFAQQQLLQKLYNELDAEREASATAAGEALSVILRLQGEKAALKMEAEQYKRLSEEKMSHAEESLAITEDIIYQKEMEVAALDCQVQAYRYKLLSMGCIDPDNLLQRTENLARWNSAPLALKYKNEINERGSCSVQNMDLVSKIVEEKTGEEMYDKASDSDRRSDNSNPEGISSYWEQIRKLDVRVKEIGGASYKNSRSGTISTSSLSSRISAGNLCNETRSPSPQISISDQYNEIDQTKGTADSLQNGVAYDYHPCSQSIYDVFEVPQADQSLSKEENRTVFRGRCEPDCLLQSNHSEKNLHESSDVDPIHCHLAVVQTRTSVSESRLRLNQFNGTSEIVQIERTAESANREEELKLLNEIKEQISSLHDEIRSWKVKISSPTDESSLCALREAMVYFWL